MITNRPLPVKKHKLPHNFAGLPAKHSGYGKSKIVVLPVPFDKTSSWIKGSDRGPEAIINASKNMELYDIETESEVYMYGIHTDAPVRAGTSLKMIDAVCRRVAKCLNDNKFVVLLGGEHTVSLGSIKAHIESFDELSILHLDAHSDMRDSYEDNRFSHACVMARVKELTDRIVSVGVRSMDSSELKNIRRNNVVYASEIRGSKSWVQKVVRKLSGDVYITIDADVFDPSIMPSTGTPEPGGLGWYEVMDLLKTVSKARNIVGFDVVELCPSQNVAPDFLASKLIYKLLSFKFYYEKPGKS